MIPRHGGVGAELIRRRTELIFMQTTILLSQTRSNLFCWHFHLYHLFNMNDRGRAVFWLSPLLSAVCTCMLTRNLKLTGDDTIITSKTLPDQVMVKPHPRAQEPLSVTDTITKCCLESSEKEYNQAVLLEEKGSPTGKQIKDEENSPVTRKMSAPIKEVDMLQNSFKTFEEGLARCQVAEGEDAVVVLKNELQQYYGEVSQLLEQKNAPEVKVKPPDGEKLAQKSLSWMERAQLSSARECSQQPKQNYWRNSEHVASTSFSNKLTDKWKEGPTVSKATHQGTNTEKYDMQKNKREMLIPNEREMLIPAELENVFHGGLSAIFKSQGSTEIEGQISIAEDQENFNPMLGRSDLSQIKKLERIKEASLSDGKHVKVPKPKLKTSRLVQGLKSCLHRIQLHPLGEDEARIEKGMSIRVMFEKTVFQAINSMYRFELINTPQMLAFFSDSETAMITGNHLSSVAKIKEGASYHRIDLDIDFFKENWSTYHLRHCLIDFHKDLQIDVIHSAFSTFVNMIRIKQAPQHDSTFQKSLSFFTRKEFPTELKSICKIVGLNQHSAAHTDNISQHIQNIVQSFAFPHLFKNTVEHNINFQMLNFLWRYGPYNHKKLSEFLSSGREFARNLNLYSSFTYEKLTIKLVELGRLLNLCQDRKSILIREIFSDDQFSKEKNDLEEKYMLLSELEASLGDPEFEFLKLESDKWLWLPDP